MIDSKVDMITDILRASFKREFPGNIYLCHTRADHENYEGNMLLALLKDTDWNFFIRNECQAIKDNLESFKRNSFLSFLKTEGLIYYLPAFLIFAAEYKDLEFMESLFFRLMPGNTEFSMNQFGNFFSELTEGEIAAIKKVLPIINEIWLSYGIEDNGARKALDSYWEFV